MPWPGENGILGIYIKAEILTEEAHLQSASEHMLVIYCFITNYHQLSGLNSAYLLPPIFSRLGIV